jgi:biotin carboxylase
VEVKPLVIVDAYSAGVDLARSLHQRGFSLVHVRSSEDLPSELQRDYPSDLFSVELKNGPDLLEKLQKLQPSCIFMGCEAAVNLADQLTEKLGLLTNGTHLSFARRCKSKMKEVLREVGVPCAPFFSSSDLPEILQRIDTEFGYPVVLKPMASSGSDGVTICWDRTMVGSAFESIMTKSNMMGERNTEALVEGFLHGQEYIVNTVSYQGRHFVIDISVSKKMRGACGKPIYDSIDLLQSEGPEQEAMTEYFFSVLDALEIKNGPAHGELILTPEGPRLVEVGARLAGAGLAQTFGCFTSYSAIDATIDVYTDPKKFLEKSKIKYQILAHVSMLFMKSARSGIVKHVPDDASFKSLRSFRELKWYVPIGDSLVPTEDLLSSPGSLILVSEDPATICSDSETFRSEIEPILLEKIIS